MEQSAPHQPSKQDQPKPDRPKVDPKSTERMDLMFAQIAQEARERATRGGEKS